MEGRLEMGLWATDFVITGLGWALGGKTAAMFCFVIGGILVFLAVSKEEKDERGVPIPSRLKRWHRYGMATFIALLVVMVGVFVVRKVMQPEASTTSPSAPAVSQAPNVTAQGPSVQTPAVHRPKRTKPKHNTSTQQQGQSNSGGTNTQQQVSGSNNSQVGGSITQGPGSALSFGQQGGITAGTVNLGPPEAVLSWEPLNSPQPFDAATVHHPVTWASVWTDRNYEKARLDVVCDRPCTARGMGMPGYNQDCFFSLTPNEIIFVVAQPNPFPGGVKAAVSVYSADYFPVAITEIKKATLTQDVNCK